MRLHWILIACLVGSAAGCRRSEQTSGTTLPEPDLIASVHFMGTAQIATDTNSAAFRDLCGSPEAQRLKEQTLQKLARAPYDLLQLRLAPAAETSTNLIRPLLDDLLRVESFFGMCTASNGAPEMALAVRLDAVSAQTWNTNLAAVLTQWTGLPIKETQMGGAAGWELKKHLPPDLIRFVHVGDWVVLGCGQDRLPLTERLVQRLQTQGRPVAAAKDYWLKVRADWPRLSPWVTLPTELKLAQMVVKAVGSGGNLRTEATIIYPQPLALELDSWRVPTNTIREPLVSFAAARGTRGWLGRLSLLQPYKWEPMPNQIYVWALAQVPFQTFIAAPAPDASNVVRRLGEQFASRLNPSLQKRDLGQMELNTSTAEISWSGLPFISPFVQAVQEPAGGFVLAGMFVNTPRSVPPPAELLAQLGRTNLVYYDWEITAERLAEWGNFSQLFLLLVGKPQLNGNSAAAKWLKVVGPKLGNAVTDMTQTASNRLTLIRQAPIGLTAGELTVLANWLEATNFPECGYRLPQRSGTENMNASAKP